MLRELKNNNQGIVFVTVLIIILISMVLAISILSLNISQVKIVENELKHIQAKALSEGAFARLFINQFSDAPVDEIIDSETLGTTTFSINASIDSSGSGPTGSDSSVPLTVDVTF